MNLLHFLHKKTLFEKIDWKSANLPILLKTVIFLHFFKASGHGNLVENMQKTNFFQHLTKSMFSKTNFMY
jgi:hypothetical protein